MCRSLAILSESKICCNPNYVVNLEDVLDPLLYSVPAKIIWCVFSLAACQL
jgi:hypothetical protein